jgi:cytochrome c
MNNSRENSLMLMRALIATALLATGVTASAAQEAGDIGALLAAADPAKGQNVAKRCAACHTFEKDAANKVGPNLWNIVDRPVAAIEGFNYSDPMVAYSEGGAKTWTYANLDAYLANPKKVVPKGTMAFPGLKKAEDRANVIAYLRSLADTPAPLPGS